MHTVVVDPLHFWTDEGWVTYFTYSNHCFLELAGKCRYTPNPNPRMSYSSVNPPSSFPADDDPLIGQHLLRLVKAAEKGQYNAEKDIKAEDTTKELSALLEMLLESYHRKGLLGGSMERAQKLLPNFSKQGSATGNKSGKGKKKKSTMAILDLDKDTNISSDDTQHMLSALVRLVGGNHELSNTRIIEPTLPIRTLVTGFQVCIAIIHHMINQIHSRSENNCASVEYDLMFGISRELLTGVSRTIQGIIQSSSPEADNLVMAGFTLCSLVFTVYGLRLSRFQNILSSLRKLSILFLSRDNLYISASKTLAAFPHTGMEKYSPSILWTKSVIECLSALFVVIETVVPMKWKAMSHLNVTTAQSYISESMKTVMSSWITDMQQMNAQDCQVFFLKIVSGLSKATVAHLEAESVFFFNSVAFSSARFPILQVFDLLDIMMSFPSYAENLYFTTKKRLRMEIVESGLLSPNVIVHFVANPIKENGLCIFTAVVQSLGRPVLLPYAKRITKLAYSSFQSACSSLLRHAIDPKNSLSLDGKRNKWLNNSLAMRANAMKALNVIVCTLGSNIFVTPSSSTELRRATDSSLAQQGVSLVVGCLLELVFSRTGESWGSPSESAALVSTAMITLSSILAQGGTFLPLSSRSLIDSAIQSCLDIFRNRQIGTMFESSDVNISFLKLISACLVTPWPDGSMTNLLEEIRHAAKSLLTSPNVSVESEAKMCLLIVYSIQTQRAPPLVMLDRSSTGSEKFRSPQDSAASIKTRISAAHDTYAKSQENAIPKELIDRGIKQVKSSDNSRDRKRAKKESEEMDILDEKDVTILEASTIDIPIQEKLSEKLREFPTILNHDGNIADTNCVVDIPPISSNTNGGENFDDFDAMIPCIVDAGPDRDDGD
jgi:hypothetical protein